MTAADWKNRLIAISRAAAAGDGAPLDITSERLADMEKAASDCAIALEEVQIAYMRIAELEEHLTAPVKVEAVPEVRS